MPGVGARLPGQSEGYPVLCKLRQPTGPTEANWNTNPESVETLKSLPSKRITNTECLTGSSGFPEKNSSQSYKKMSQKPTGTNGGSANASQKTARPIARVNRHHEASRQSTLDNPGDSTKPQRTALLDWFGEQVSKCVGEHDTIF